MFIVVRNFDVGDDWHIRHDEFPELHISGHIPDVDVGDGLSRSNKQYSCVFGKTEARKLWGHRFEFITVRSQKFLLDVGGDTLSLLSLIIFVIFGQKNLKTRSLISDAIPAINLNIHSSVDGPPPDDVLEMELTGGIFELGLADSLVDLSDLKPL